MPELKDLSNKELAFLLLFKLWWHLDGGGFSNDRSPQASVIEAITRGTLLPNPQPSDHWRSFQDEDIRREALSRRSDRFLEAKERGRIRHLRDMRNPEFLAVLLRWLQDYYEEQMRKPESERPEYEHRLFLPVLALLPLPSEIPLFKLDAIVRERDRRSRLRFRRHSRLAFE